MSANLLPIYSSGGFKTSGNIIVSSFPVASPAPYICGFSTINSVLGGNLGGFNFNSNGLAVMPTGETVFRSNDDTITIESYDTPNSTSRGVRFGTDGGMYLEQTNLISTSTWLTIEPNAGNAEIYSGIGVPGSTEGKNLTIFGGQADQTTYNTSAGGNLNLYGGLGGSDDGGGGGPGGSVNISAGNSADPAGHHGNIVVNTGGSNTWTFDYTGNLTLPGNTFAVNYANGTPVSIGGGSPAGSNNEIQFNDNGAFAASGNLSFTDTIIGGIFEIGNELNLSGNGTIGTASGNLLLQPAANIILQASSSNLIFDINGNLTLPGNTFSVNYANGTQVSLTPSLLANTGNASTAKFTLLEDNTLLSGNVSSPQNFKVNDAYTPDIDLRNASGTGMFTQGANLTVRTAGTYNWGFTSTGNLTLPGNTFAVNYANGTQVTLGGSYGDSNVATLLAAYGSNTVSTTGNITSGNILTGGLISATGNVTAAAVFTKLTNATVSTATGTVSSQLTLVSYSGATTITMPAASTNTVGVVYYIKDTLGTNRTGNTITIQGASSDTIDGGTVQIISPYNSVTIVGVTSTSWGVL